ncbi:MAG: hypothetical protein HC800_21465 [Phormidesmis sp. RL_2_1]|nr:hypothetical protein [Phormidesmis sp. RL_2_1]
MSDPNNPWRTASSSSFKKSSQTSPQKKKSGRHQYGDQFAAPHYKGVKQKPLKSNVPKPKLKGEPDSQLDGQPGDQPNNQPGGQPGQPTRPLPKRTQPKPMRLCP